MSAGAQGTASEELDIMEAVFRYQVQKLGAFPRPPDRFFLSFSEKNDPPKDPPAELLARFQGGAPPVEPISAVDLDVWHGVHRKGEKGRGVILRLTRIQRIDPSTVEVDGGYYVGSRFASGDTYRVERRGSGWVVVNDTVHWVS